MRHGEVPRKVGVKAMDYARKCVADRKSHRFVPDLRKMSYVEVYGRYVRLTESYTNGVVYSTGIACNSGLLISFSRVLAFYVARASKK